MPGRSGTLGKTAKYRKYTEFLNPSQSRCAKLTLGVSKQLAAVMLTTGVSLPPLCPTDDVVCFGSEAILLSENLITELGKFLRFFSS